MLGLEVQRTLCPGSRIDEIANDLVLAVDGDRLSTRKLDKVDPMSLLTEADVQPLVPQTRTLKSRSHTRRLQQIDGPLLENPRPDAIDHVFTAAILDDDRIDAIDMKEMAEQQARGSGANDTYLRPGGAHAYARLLLPGSPLHALRGVSRNTGVGRMIAIFSAEPAGSLVSSAATSH